MRMPLSLAFLGALAAIAGPAAAERSVTVFVQEGSPVQVASEAGHWFTQDGVLQSEDRGAAIAMGGVVSEGDFHFSSVLEVDRFDRNPALIQLNEISEIGFVRPGGSLPERMFVRGFFFGDLTQDAGAHGDFVKAGEPFTFEIRREGDVVTFLLNGDSFWEHGYESEREFGKIGFRQQHGRIRIKEAALLSGNVAPLDDWIHPREVVHEQPGEQQDLFARGDGDYHTYRIPAIERTGNGALLAFCEGRRNSAADHGDIDILVRRSHDDGRTWTPMEVVHSESGDVTIGNPVPVHDHITGLTWLAFTRDNDRVFVTHSEDDGASWAEPREITASVKPAEWAGWYATGPCNGIQLRSGRLLIPANHGQSSHAFFSDDHGESWQVGEAIGRGTNEVTMAERSDGVVYMNARTPRGVFERAIAWSHDGGMTWTEVEHDPALIEPTCQGSVISADLDGLGPVFLFSNPASHRRERLTVRLSHDQGQTWEAARVLYGGSALYSDLVDLGDGWFACLYERDWYDRITFARFHISWFETDGNCAIGKGVSSGEP